MLAERSLGYARLTIGCALPAWRRVGPTRRCCFVYKGKGAGHPCTVLHVAKKTMCCVYFHGLLLSLLCTDINMTFVFVFLLCLLTGVVCQTPDRKCNIKPLTQGPSWDLLFNSSTRHCLLCAVYIGEVGGGGASGTAAYSLYLNSYLENYTGLGNGTWAPSWESVAQK